MTAKSSVSPHLIGAVLGAMVLALGAVAPGQAQQAAGSNGRMQTGISNGLDRGTANRPAAHKRANQGAPKPRAGVSGPSNALAPDGKPWSIEDALPGHQPSAVQSQKAVPTLSRPGIGRVPVEGGTGTFGLSTDNKVKSGELYDGRRAPGLETETHNPPSYLGLSLSVPTNDKSILPVPVPILPPLGRRE